jgi:methionine salvage enolase-phosphatase E1
MKQVECNSRCVHRGLKVQVLLGPVTELLAMQGVLVVRGYKNSAFTSALYQKVYQKFGTDRDSHGLS